MNARPAPPCADAISAEDALSEALRRAFWQGLHRAPLPPMQALETAARTLGALYRQIAHAHEGSAGCGYGWVPDPDGDLIVLEANLAVALLHPPQPDLFRMAVAGSA